MPLVLLSGPALEPVTLAEAKAHCRIDSGAEDALLASLILTSRLHIEVALGLALLTQSFRLTLDRWPQRGRVAIPVFPLQSVSAVRVLAADGTPSVVPPTSYETDTSSRTPRLVLTRPPGEPGRATCGIEIDLVAGYGDAASDVPAPIRQALLLLLAHWYEHRDPLEIGSSAAHIPGPVSDLLLPYRGVRL